MIADDYNQKISEGLHNDADMTTDGKGLYYNNGNLTVGDPTPYKNNSGGVEMQVVGLERGSIEEKENKMEPQKEYVETEGNPIKK